MRKAQWVSRSVRTYLRKTRAHNKAATTTSPAASRRRDRRAGSLAPEKAFRRTAGVFAGRTGAVFGPDDAVAIVADGHLPARFFAVRTAVLEFMMGPDGAALAALCPVQGDQAVGALGGARRDRSPALAASPLVHHG